MNWFYGEDPATWLSEIEDWFDELAIPMNRYVDLAVPYLRGAAMSWAFENASLVCKGDWCAFSYHLLWEFDPTTKVHEEDEFPVDTEENNLIEGPVQETFVLETSSDLMVASQLMDLGNQVVEYILQDQILEIATINAVQGSTSCVAVQGSTGCVLSVENGPISVWSMNTLPVCILQQGEACFRRLVVKQMYMQGLAVANLGKEHNGRVNSDMVMLRYGHSGHPQQLFDEMFVNEVVRDILSSIWGMEYLCFVFDDDGLTPQKAWLDSGDATDLYSHNNSKEGNVLVHNVFGCPYCLTSSSVHERVLAVALSEISTDQGVDNKVYLPIAKFGTKVSSISVFQLQADIQVLNDVVTHVRPCGSVVAYSRCFAPNPIHELGYTSKLVVGKMLSGGTRAHAGVLPNIMVWNCVHFEWLYGLVSSVVYKGSRRVVLISITYIGHEAQDRLAETLKGSCYEQIHAFTAMQRNSKIRVRQQDDDVLTKIIVTTSGIIICPLFQCAITNVAENPGLKIGTLVHNLNFAWKSPVLILFHLVVMTTSFSIACFEVIRNCTKTKMALDYMVCNSVIRLVSVEQIFRDNGRKSLFVCTSELSLEQGIVTVLMFMAYYKSTFIVLLCTAYMDGQHSKSLLLSIDESILGQWESLTQTCTMSVTILAIYIVPPVCLYHPGKSLNSQWGSACLQGSHNRCILAWADSFVEVKDIRQSKRSSNKTEASIKIYILSKTNFFVQILYELWRLVFNRKGPGYPIQLPTMILDSRVDKQLQALGLLDDAEQATLVQVMIVQTYNIGMNGASNCWALRAYGRVSSWQYLLSHKAVLVLNIIYIAENQDVGITGIVGLLQAMTGWFVLWHYPIQFLLAVLCIIFNRSTASTTLISLMDKSVSRAITYLLGHPPMWSVKTSGIFKGLVLLPPPAQLIWCRTVPLLLYRGYMVAGLCLFVSPQGIVVVLWIIAWYHYTTSPSTIRSRIVALVMGSSLLVCALGGRRSNNMLGCPFNPTRQYVFEMEIHVSSNNVFNLRGTAQKTPQSRANPVAGLSYPTQLLAFLFHQNSSYMKTDFCRAGKVTIWCYDPGIYTFRRVLLYGLYNIQLVGRHITMVGTSLRVPLLERTVAEGFSLYNLEVRAVNFISNTLHSTMSVVDNCSSDPYIMHRVCMPESTDITLGQIHSSKIKLVFVEDPSSILCAWKGQVVSQGSLYCLQYAASWSEVFEHQ